MRICRACGSQHTEWFPSGLLSAVERCVRRGRRDSASRGATIHLNLKPRPVEAAHKESANLTLYGAAVVAVSVKKFTELRRRRCCFRSPPSLRFENTAMSFCNAIKLPEFAARCQSVPLPGSEASASSSSRQCSSSKLATAVRCAPKATS